MAKAKERTVRKTVEVPDGVTLDLTAEEARVLRHVTMRIAGGFGGPRGVMMEIGGALRRAGVTKPVLNMVPGQRVLGYYEDPVYRPSQDETTDERPF